MKNCKHCGGCDVCERCSHCGKCKNCGKYIQPLGTVPYQQPYTVPYMPYLGEPIWPSTTICSGTYQDGNI